MTTEFNDAQHYGLFMTGTTLTSQTGKYVRQSELVLAALRAQGVLDNLEDGTTAPTHDKLWLDKNSDPAVLKEWDSVSSTWQTMTFDRLFGRATVTDLTNVAGTANAITADEPSPFMDGKIYGLVPTLSNTGATTIQVAGVGTYDVVYPDGTDIAAGELAADLRTPLLFTNGRFEVLFGSNAGSIKRAETDASSFSFVNTGTLANSGTTVPSESTVKAYADTKAPLKTSLTGTVAADSNPGEFQGYALNEWKITDDATVGATADPGRQAYGIHINHVYGGDTLRGSRIALSVFSELSAASKDETGGGQNYVAGQFITLADDKDNGTDTGSGAKGAFFALNPVAILRGTAENVLHLSCGEFNIGTDDTTTLRYKCFANFANYPTDAAKGAEVDAVLWFYKQGSGAVGFDYGLLFSNEVLGGSGVQLLDTGGTILAAKDDGTCAVGFDFTDWTFTTAVLRSKGFQIGATGKVAASTDVHIVEPNGATATITTGSVPDAQGDVLGTVRFGFQDQSTFVDRLGADIRALANSAWTAGSSQPSILQFRAAASGSVTLSEQMRLSPGDAGTGKTAMFLNVEGTLVQVTVGAADSGGTGKRQLVVPNAA